MTKKQEFPLFNEFLNESKGMLPGMTKEMKEKYPGGVKLLNILMNRSLEDLKDDIDDYISGEADDKLENILEELEYLMK